MTRRRERQGAEVVQHPATIFRAWTIETTASGQYIGILRSQRGQEARTEVGPESLVLRAIQTTSRYRGVPIVQPVGKTAEVGS